MRCLTVLCCCTAILAACQKPQPPAHADSTAVAATPAPPPPPAPLSPADVAGKWNVTAKGVNDTMVVHYVLNATNTTSGWTVTLPKRSPIPVRVTFDGDSVISDAGPFPSVTRKGLMVTTHNVTRLQGGKLVGTGVAHYKTTKPDSVRQTTSEG